MKLYNHDLWLLLAPENIASEKVSKYLRVVLRRRCLWRPTIGMQRHMPAKFAAAYTRKSEQHLLRFVREGSLDSVAIIVALCREAKFQQQRALMETRLTKLTAATVWFCGDRHA